MHEWIDQILLSLQDIAQQRVQYDQTYLSLCRKVDHSFQNFWNSLSEEQKARYLCFETNSNDRDSVEEDQLIRQVFLLTRELYR